MTVIEKKIKAQKNGREQEQEIGPDNTKEEIKKKLAGRKATKNKMKNPIVKEY